MRNEYKATAILGDGKRLKVFKQGTWRDTFSSLAEVKEAVKSDARNRGVRTFEIGGGLTVSIESATPEVVRYQIQTRQVTEWEEVL